MSEEALIKVLNARIDWFSKALAKSKIGNEQQQRKLADRDTQIRQLEAALADRDKQIRLLEAALADRDKQICAPSEEKAPPHPEHPVCTFNIKFGVVYPVVCRMPSSAVRLPIMSVNWRQRCPAGSINTQASPSKQAIL